MSQNELFTIFSPPNFIRRTGNNKKDADYAHICFIGKYRDNHKRTKYVFKSPEIHAEKVSNKLLEWLEKSIAKVDFDNIPKYNPGVPQETNEWTELNKLNSWDSFLKPINHNFDREISQKELEKMGTNFIGSMIFCHKNGCVYGQITRLQPRFVLNNSESFLAIFDSNVNKYISELKEERGFRISPHSDVLFNIDDQKVGRAIIFSKKNYEDIFDLSWELEKNAIDVFHRIDVFTKNPVSNDLLNLVKEDRTIQRMLNNRVLINNEVRYLTFIELKRLKEVAGNILLFNISDDGKSFVLPTDGTKGKALRQIIKAISRRYIVGENGEIFMENAGITASWTLFKKEMTE